MHRMWLATSLVVVSTAWGGPPGGRVVRIERERVVGDPGPLLCQIDESLSGRCIGRTPRHGDIVTIVDDTHVVAQANIVTFEQDATERCDGLWSVGVELLRGDLTQYSDRIGVVDGLADPTALRKLENSDVGALPTGNPLGAPIIAIDRDGDRHADIIVTRYPCDVAGHPTTNSAVPCLDVWTRRSSGGFVRTSQTNLTACQIARP